MPKSEQKLGVGRSALIRFSVIFSKLIPCVRKSHSGPDTHEGPAEMVRSRVGWFFGVRILRLDLLS